MSRTVRPEQCLNESGHGAKACRPLCSPSSHEKGHIMIREAQDWFCRLLTEHRKVHRITANACEVDTVLCEMLGDDERIIASHATIAARAGCCQRTVWNALAQLRELGLVTWERWPPRNTDTIVWLHLSKPNTYILHTNGLTCQAR